MKVRTLGVSVLCAALAFSGCASASGGAKLNTIAPPLDRALVEQYVQRLPSGARVKVEKTSGGTVHGTLLEAAPDSIVVQANTRVPEPPVEIRFSDIARLTLEPAGGSTARAVAIGVATGVGSFFGVLVLIAALAGD